MQLAKFTKVSTKMAKKRANDYYDLPMEECMMANGLREKKMATG